MNRLEEEPRAAHASICAAWARLCHQRALDELLSNELAAKQPAARRPLLNMNQFQSPMCHFPVSSGNDSSFLLGFAFLWKMNKV